MFTAGAILDGWIYLCKILYRQMVERALKGFLTNNLYDMSNKVGVDIAVGLPYEIIQLMIKGKCGPVNKINNWMCWLWLAEYSSGVTRESSSVKRKNTQGLRYHRSPGINLIDYCCSSNIFNTVDEQTFAKKVLVLAISPFISMVILSTAE